MAEAQLTRASSGGGSCLFSGITLDEYNALIEDRVQIAITTGGNGSMLFTSNGYFEAPKTGTYQVICFGGGGGGGNSLVDSYWGYTWFGGGGGSGYLNSASVNLNKGDIVQVTVGDGGIRYSGSLDNKSVRSNSGGTSSFGSYVSAPGGQGGQCGSWYGYTNITGAGGAGYKSGVSGHSSPINMYMVSDVSSLTKSVGGAGIYPPDKLDGSSNAYGYGGNGSMLLYNNGAMTGAQNGKSGCVWVGWS